jgi:CubicO group peptidase (beta-lactamase class C family)
MFTRREFALTLAACAALRPLAAHEDPDAARVRGLVNDWVGARRQSPGVTVALVTPRGPQFFAAGALDLRGGRAPDAGTVFGIASLTKVFTGLLLADAVLRDEVSLNDRIADYLPTGVRVPSFEGREITLRDLALQVSGLPQEIADSTAAAARSDAGEAALYDFISRHQLTRPIGESWSYSNIGYALLGIALARRAASTFERLIIDRIADPLGLVSTRISITPSMRANRASPHVDATTPVQEWHKPWSLAAGALQSSARDLATFLSAAMGINKTPLDAAFAFMQSVTAPSTFLGGSQAIGWAIDQSDGAPRVFFGGRAPGFTSAMMFDPAEKRGVVALANSSLMVESLAREVLRPGSTAATGDDAPVATNPLLDRFAGRYIFQEGHPDARFAAGESIDIVRTGDGIAASMPRYPRVPLRQLGAHRFDIEGFGVVYDFEPGTSPAARLTLTINGKAVTAVRE